MQWSMKPRKMRLRKHCAFHFFDLRQAGSPRPGWRGLRGQQSHQLHSLEHVRQDIRVVPAPARLPQGLL